MQVRGRLRSLAILELINIPLLGYAASLLFAVTPGNVVAFGCVALLLVIGSAYWWARFWRIRHRRRRTPGLRWFALARMGCVVILPTASVFVVWQAVADPWRSWPGVPIVLFAWLEYVNYFHTQLSYGRLADRERLRRSGFARSHLGRELASRHSS